MRDALRVLVGIGLVGMCAAPPSLGGEGERPGAAEVAFFETKVRPVLANHCFECHGPETQKGNLRLDARETLLEGGDYGPAVEPGDPAESLLIEAIRYEDAFLRMPPKGPLDEADIAALTEWVRMGAPWPSTEEPVRPAIAAEAGGITEEDRAFWAFQPVTDPPPPAVQDQSWPQSSIDAFVLAKLEEQGLRPAPPADKRTLIRRATFDLTGLPPTPEEIEAFVHDDAPDAFAKVVDRLLVSPHYGERWGRHWLDVARYGEDQAHSFRPRLYPSGFRYRDWLVSALNHDMPYDRFILEQIAGDLLDEPGRLDRLPALGFFALGPVYYGDPKKLDQYDDRIDTLTRGFLGLTVACARCHDHKYDPIPTTDYYALAGVVASTEYEEAPVAPPEVVETYNQAQAVIETQEKQIEDFLESEAGRLVEARASEIARYVVASWTLRTQPDGDLDTLAAEVAREDGLNERLLKRWFAYLTRSHPPVAERPHLAFWSQLLESLEPDSEPTRDEDARTQVTRKAEEFQQRVQELLALRAERSRAGDAATTAQAVGDGSRAPSEASLDEADMALLDELFGDEGLLTVPSDRVERLLGDEAKATLDTMRTELERLKDEAPPMYPVTHALTEADEPTDMAVLIRGNPDTPGEVVPRRFLTILGGDQAPFTQGSGRLELAQAIARPDNPLTARVLVNRLWQHHFGRGLVGTPSNFGVLGERPTHPELLDHLARRFLASGWSLKAMHRAIMLSATYQQDSRFHEHAFQVDPENKLLWRMNRRRLEVEAWRDAMLAVSGRLDPSLGGPSLPLDDPDNRRRTFYAAVSRHDLSPLLRLFDFPDPNITSGERTETTVPLQQLLVLNSDFLVQNAQALAARLTAEADRDDADRVRHAYLLVFGRPASDDELQLALDYLNGSDPEDSPRASLTRWERYAQILLGTNEFAYID